MARRRSVSQRPARPGPFCEVCGADVWWAWSLHGRCWLPLVPERFEDAGAWGTFEVWPDAHGGLLAAHLPAGERGSRERSFRGAHHNTVCSTWRPDACAALVREVSEAVPVVKDSHLLVLSRQLQDLQQRISSEIRTRALRAEE